MELQMELPYAYISESVCQISINQKVYEKEAIIGTCYRYTNDYYINITSSDCNDEAIFVTIEQKSGDKLPIDVIKSFFNDLIDQQERLIINRHFGHIRDMIVEEAFKPINCK